MWGASVGSNSQLVTWKVGDARLTTLTTDAHDHTDQQISGDRIVWEAATDSGPWDQIFTWKLGDPSPSKLTSVSTGQEAPQISENRVAWIGFDPTYLQVFTAATTYTSLSKPGLSPSTPTHKKTVTFSTYLAPGAAASGTYATLYLYRWESKTVRRKVLGRWHRVKVRYWRSRGTLHLTSSGGDPARLSANTKLKYSGSWKAWATCPGWAGFEPSSSSTKTFKVK